MERGGKERETSVTREVRKREIKMKSKTIEKAVRKEEVIRKEK